MGWAWFNTPLFCTWFIKASKVVIQWNKTWDQCFQLNLTRLSTDFRGNRGMATVGSTNDMKLDGIEDAWSWIPLKGRSTAGDLRPRRAVVVPKATTEQWSTVGGTRVVHGSLSLDPTRPDPAKRWPDPTRPAIGDKKSDPTRPDPTRGPTLPPYV